MSSEKVSVADKLNKVSDYWNPVIVGELNNQHVKLVKFKGEFIWHQHEGEDEMFYVLEGEFDMHFRDKVVHLKKNEFIIVQKGLEHKPVAKSEVSVMLFEPTRTSNTGNQVDDVLTQNNLNTI